MDSLSDHVYERMLRQRIIVVGATLDAELANRVCAQMLLLAAEDPSSEISLYLNCPGGPVADLRQVLDTMARIECDVATTAMGLAAGTGAVLLAAGTPGRRSVLPLCKVLLTPVASDGSASADEHRRAEDAVVTVLARATGLPAWEISCDMAGDRWYSAAEAVAYGLADRVVETAGEAAPAPGGQREAVVAPRPTPATLSDDVLAGLLARRGVLLDGDIDAESANDVMAQLLVTGPEDPRSPMTLYLRSSGGSWADGMAVHDTMRYLECGVATCAVGDVAGMAQVLLSAGAPGQRVVLRGARVRMTGVQAPAGTVTDEHARTELARIEQTLVTLVAGYTGQPPGRVRADVADGRWFDADEAVAYGLADRVEDPPTDVAPAPVGRNRRATTTDVAQEERLLAERIVVIDGELDGDTADRVAAQLLLLAADGSSEIRLRIASPGGGVSAALAVSDTMTLIDCDVATCGTGLVAGTAAILLAAGTPGRRRILPHGEVQLVPVVSGDGSVSTDALRRTEEQISSLLADATGRPAARIRKDMAAARRFSAAGAVGYGFVDRVAEHPTDG